MLVGFKRCGYHVCLVEVFRIEMEKTAFINGTYDFNIPKRGVRLRQAHQAEKQHK